jgi:hypothetical protein
MNVFSASGSVSGSAFYGLDSGNNPDTDSEGFILRIFHWEGIWVIGRKY